MTATLIHTLLKTPLGEMEVAVFQNKLCLFDFVHRKSADKIKDRVTRFFNAGFETGEHELFDTVKEKLEAYLSGKLFEFDIPLAFSGSEFQNKVWKQLLNIPYGETNSYASLTKKIGEPTLIRAVAGANGANCLAILVPCHRVIGTDGNLVGYAGGITTKRHLLNLEREHNPNRMTLF